MMSQTHTIATMSRPDFQGEKDSAASRLEVRIRKQLGAPGQFRLDVAFQADPGFTILFGPSGAGKTTLLDCVAGLVTPDAGRISSGGRVWFDHDSRSDLPVARRRCGYVFQNLA